MFPQGPLAGQGVLITRPAHQAESLCKLVAAAGGRPIPFPVLRIEPVGDPTWVRNRLAQPVELLIFISRNAVEFSLPLFPEGRLPTAPKLAAIGRATAEALTQAGRAPDLVPERYDSESLLALPELQDLRGQRVTIVRGEGGRPLLGKTLQARGAIVRYAQPYRRVRPNLDVQALLGDYAREVQLLTATSNEVLENLVAILGPAHRAQLVATPLAVFSPRTAQKARELGFQRVAVAERADDAGLVAALVGLVRQA